MNDRPETAERLPKASPLETWRIMSTVVMPVIAQGFIVRRPSVVALISRLGFDVKAVSLMRRLRSKYGPGPLLVRIPGRCGLLILAPRDVHRILEQSPDPFTPDHEQYRREYEQSAESPSPCAIRRAGGIEDNRTRPESGGATSATAIEPPMPRCFSRTPMACAAANDHHHTVVHPPIWVRIIVSGLLCVQQW